jgi:cellulose synthase/poly-beta-1,6-N-acetylglucosamine synthase-like glycosyltransferase
MGNFEAVLVDDGSTDSTFDIASAFEIKETRFKVIRQPNGGLADARNAAIRHTQAPLIAALDSDDVWHPTFLAKLSSALETGGRDTVLAYANSRIIDLAGCVLNNAPSYGQSGWAFNQLLLHNFIGNGSAMMFRRDLAVGVGAYDRRLQHEFGAQGCEDWLLAMRLAAHGRIVAVREYLVGYRSVPGAMSENTLRMRRSRLHALEILYSEIECRHSKPARWALGTAHAKCFLHEIRSPHLGNALSSLLAALRLDLVGTCCLLFGPERLTWFKREFFEQRISQQRRSFQDFDPHEGQWDHIIARVEHAHRWDVNDGPIADSTRMGDAVAHGSSSKRGLS